MDASLDKEQDNKAGGHKSDQQGDHEHQIGISEDTDKTALPSLSEFKKSWGFRRTTVARREFMDEIIDLDSSPLPVRRGRSRRTRQTRQSAVEPKPPSPPSRSASSVLDNLEWSAPSSPVNTVAEEASTGGALDPSLWQDFGSAFHTAFSLLGGNEDTPADGAEPLPGPDVPFPPAFDELPASAEVPESGADGSDCVGAGEDSDVLDPVPMDMAEEESPDVLLISSQEDSDNLTLMQLKEQLTSKSRAGRGGRGKARGKGRGRGRGKGRGKGRGRGRGRAVELESSTADDDEDQAPFNQAAQPQPHEQQKPGSSQDEVVKINSSHSPANPIDSDCIVLDSDLDQSADCTPGKYDDAVEDVRVEERCYSSISESEGYDPDALYCVCRQKHNKRFMICCDGCQEWFHGECVGIVEAQGRSMERRGEDYTCPTCTSKKLRASPPDFQPDPSPGILSDLLGIFTPTTPVETVAEVTKPQESKGAAEVTEVQVKQKVGIKTKADGSFPLCIGPGCPKQALQDSVYCGTECIVQHAAVAMKSLTVPKEPKTRSRPQRKAAAKGQRSAGVTRSAAERLKESEEEQGGNGGLKESAAPLSCAPGLGAVEAAPAPSSVLCMASTTEGEDLEAKRESVPLVPQEPTIVTLSSAPVADTPLPQGGIQGKTKNPSTTSKKQQLASPHYTPANLPKLNEPPVSITLDPSSSRPGVLLAAKIAKGSFVIPKKQPVSQPAPSQGPGSAVGPTPTPSNAAASETRTLPVAPAPIAPSSRPSQPNNQVRQSIQRSLTSILFKRVTGCGEFPSISMIDVGKLVTSIEMEMFDIFRNTDSKYMNKYRTIMFNLKDPKNKGLLVRVIRGEISPFRLARMSQKDMQATKVPEPSAKDTEVKDSDGKRPPCSLQKPDTVKVELSALSTPKSEKPMEQKRSIPPAAKSRPAQPSHISSVSDMLNCMLKDTTSEHKTHLFDLKCRICTGQLSEEEEEPAQKRSKVYDTRDKREHKRTSYGKLPENPWRSCAGDDSPLRAPPDSPDMDSPPNLLLEPSSCLIIDTPELSIVETPMTPVLESPASPVLESPTSPVMDSPSSPATVSFKAKPPSRTYSPVVIPAVSTVTITRRDPRTAANRCFGLSSGAPGPGCTPQNQMAPLTAPRVATSGPTMPPAMPLPPQPMPKSILTKLSSSVDPRLYQTSARNVNSHSAADGETTQFLANQTILWKGFLNMLSVAKFMTKGYVVSGSGELLKPELPDTIQIGGRILPQTVWDYVERLKTSVTKELCVIRFHPATEEEEVAYVSLFSYFSSRRRFGVVADSSRNIKDMYLVPISAKEAIPSILQPLDGPGLEKTRPNLLLGLAIVQKPKRPGSIQQESEEKRPKVQMSKDPMWIPKPPVLYGSDQLDFFQPYDPETPIPCSPPSSQSSSGTLTTPSLSVPSNSTTPRFVQSNSGTPSVLTSTPVSSNQSIPTATSDSNSTATSATKTPLQNILKSLFRSTTTDEKTAAESSSVVPTVFATKPLYTPQTNRPMVDPIVQQYGQKSKIKKIEEEEENDFDRPYDPEEEYDPAMGYEAAKTAVKAHVHTDPLVLSTFGEEDVAYDPEDESMFEDVKKHNIIAKDTVPFTTTIPTPASNQAPAPAATSDTALATNAPVQPNLPTGVVVVSAATLTEQQRMLEDLNKQIEEQKRQLKEQEEALRQQRETVGKFMAHFSVSDTLMSPPQKVLAATLLPSQQFGTEQAGQKTLESTDKGSPTKAMDNQTLELVKKEETNMPPAIIEQEQTVKDNEQYFSAGEIEDSDVAYDPEDESLFNEMQDDIFQGDSTKPQDASLSRSGHGSPRKGSPSSLHRGRRQRGSPKRRSRRERDHRGSPSRSGQQRSPSHSRRRKDKERHRRSERDRSRHSNRDQAERQGRHRRERTSRRHSRGQRESPSSKRRDSASFSPNIQLDSSAPVLQESQNSSAQSDPPLGPVQEPQERINTSHPPVAFKSNHIEPSFKCNKTEFTGSNSLTNSKTEPNSSPKSSSSLNIKLEKEERPLSLIPLKYATWHQQGMNSSALQFKNELALNSKIECTIPLRVLEPPTRDSPQSPDPEPQFVKQSSTEQGAVEVVNKLEEIVDVSGRKGTGILFENDFLRKCLTGTNITGLGAKNAKPDLQDPLMHNIPSLGGDISNIENNLGPSVLRLGITAPTPIIQPGSNTSATMVRGLWQLIGDPDMQGMGPDCWKTGQNKSNAGRGVHGENLEIPVIQNPDINLGHAMRQPSIMAVDSNVHWPYSVINPEGRVPGLAGTQPHLKVQDVVGSEQGMALDSRGLAMMDAKGGISDSVEIGDLRTDMRGRGPSWSRFADYSQNTSNASHMRDCGIKDEIPDLQSLHMASARKEYQGLRSNPSEHQCHVKQETGAPYIGSDGDNQATQWPVGSLCPNLLNEKSNKEPGPNTGVPCWDGSWGAYEPTECNPICPGSDARDEWKGSVRRGLDSTFSGLDVQDELRSFGPNKIEHMEIPRPERRGPDREHQLSHRGDSAFKGPGPDRRVPHIEGTGPEMCGFRSKPVEGARSVVPGTDCKGQLPETEGHRPDMSRSDCHDIREPGSYGRGQGVSVGLDERVRGGPYFVEHGNDRGMVFEGSRTARGGANMEGRGQDRRGTGGPDFRGPSDERRGSGMEGSDFAGAYVEGPGPDGRRVGGADFRGTRSARRGAHMDSPGRDRKGQGGLQFGVPGPDRSETDIKSLRPAMRVREPESGHDGKGSEMGALGLERQGRGGSHFRGPGTDRMGSDMQGPDRTGQDRESPESERRGQRSPDLRRAPPERRRPDMEVPVPVWKGMGGRKRQDKEGLSVNRSGPDSGGSDFVGTAPDGRRIDVENQGLDMARVESTRVSGPELGPEKRGGQRPDLRGHGIENNYEFEPYMGGISNINCRGQQLGTDRRPRRPDTRSLGLEMIGPDMKCTESEIQSHVPHVRMSCGPIFKGPGPDRRGPVGPDSQGPMLDRGGPVGPDLREPVPDWRLGVDSDTLELGPDPDFSSPGFDRIASDGQDFMESEPDWKMPCNPDFSVDRSGGRGPVDPDFGRLGPIRRGSGPPDFRDLRPEIRGPGGVDVIGPGPNRRDTGNPDFGGSVPDGRGPSGPDFRRPGVDRRGPGGPVFREPGPDRRGPNCPDSMVLDNDRRGLCGPDFLGAGLDERGPCGPDFRRPGPDRRGPYGPDFGGSGPDRRRPDSPDFGRPGPDFGGLGPDGRGPDGPDFRGPRPDRRGPGGPDFRGSGPDRRVADGPDFGGPGPDGRGPGGPDFRGPGPDRRGPNGPDFGGPGPDWRGPDGPGFRGPGPDRRGPDGPDFGGPGPDRRGPGGPGFRGPGPDRRGPDGPDFGGPGPDGRGPGGPGFRGPGPDKRGPGGPDFGGPGPDGRGPSRPGFRGPGPDRRGPGGPDYRGPSPDGRRPGPERRGPDFRGPRSDRRAHGGPEFREPGPDRRGTDFRGHSPDRRASGGSNFGRPGPERRGPGGIDFGEPGLDGRGPSRTDFRGPLPERRGPGGPDFRGSEHDRRGRGRPNFRGRGADRRVGGPESGRELEYTQFEDLRSSENEDLSGTWPNQEFCSGPGPFNRGSGIEGPILDRRRPNMEGPYRGGVDGGYPTILGDGPVIVDDWQQDDCVSELESSDREYHGSRGRGRGPGLGGEFRDPNLEDPWLVGRGPERNQGIASEQEREAQVTRPDIKGPPSQGKRGTDPRGVEADFNKGIGMRGSQGLKSRDPGLPTVPEIKSLGSHGQSSLNKTLSPSEDIGALPNNQSANRLLKHKTPLLPTPTGLVRHSSRLVHTPNAFVHGRDWNRTPAGKSRGAVGQSKKEDNPNEKLKDPLICETDSDKNPSKTDDVRVNKKATE